MTRKMQAFATKFSIILFAFVLIAIAPTMTAEAKTKDASKVVNMTVSDAAKYLGIKTREDQGLFVYIFNKNDNNGFVTDHDHLNRKQYWDFTLRTKTNINIYGTNVGMKRTKIHKILTKKGFKCVKGCKWTDSWVNYINSKDYTIEIQYKTNKKNSKPIYISLTPRSYFTDGI